MLRTYPLDPQRQSRQPGILVLIQRHAVDLAASGRQPRTPASRTQTGAGLVLASSIEPR
ncbi:MAG TPA: hypothetical protein VEG29_01585 [Candidatus Binatia bacterium]|nr:hypothetical protein [Candidatus Binatia bacterium]